MDFQTATQIIESHEDFKLEKGKWTTIRVSKTVADYLRKGARTPSEAIEKLIEDKENLVYKIMKSLTTEFIMLRHTIEARTG